MNTVLFLCTGNAVRSVIAGAMMGNLRPDLRVETAGTLAVEGMVMSWRTREALQAVGLSCPDHRSKQANRDRLDRADLVVALAPEHVAWVRRNHLPAAERTSTLKHLVGTLSASPQPLGDRLTPLGLAARTVDPAEEIDDPAGGELEIFIACAREVVALVDGLAERV